MNDLNVFKIVKEGIREISDSELKRFVELLAPPRCNPEIRDALYHLIEKIFLVESVKQRERIIKAAEKKHSNSNLKSAFCLSILKIELKRNIRKEKKRETYPGLDLIYRQVEMHLAKKRGRKGGLQSQMKYGPKGQHMAMYWGLDAWGENMQERPPGMSLADLKESLPEIRTDEGGKGIFKYKRVLPEYLKLILETYGAPLPTAAIKSVILSRLVPQPFCTKRTVGYVDEKAYESSSLSGDFSQAIGVLSAVGSFEDQPIREPSPYETKHSAPDHSKGRVKSKRGNNAASDKVERPVVNLSWPRKI
jgi:hypothetical protein